MALLLPNEYPIAPIMGAFEAGAQLSTIALIEKCMPKPTPIPAEITPLPPRLKITTGALKFLLNIPAGTVWQVFWRATKMGELNKNSAATGQRAAYALALAVSVSSTSALCNWLADNINSALIKDATTPPKTAHPGYTLLPDGEDLESSEGKAIEEHQTLRITSSNTHKKMGTLEIENSDMEKTAETKLALTPWTAPTPVQETKTLTPSKSSDSISPK